MVQLTIESHGTEDQTIASIEKMLRILQVKGYNITKATHSTRGDLRPAKAS